MLSAVARLHGKFGVGVVAEVLAGADNEKTAALGARPAHRVRPAARALGQAHHRDAPPPDGGRPRPPARPGRREVPPGRRADGRGRGRDEGRAAPAGEPRRPRPAPRLPAAAAVRPPDRDRANTPASTSATAGGSCPSAARTPTERQRRRAARRRRRQRFERLRAVRLRLAREQEVPPYVICKDATLKLIAQSAPADAEALEQVKGMGPYKVKTYGPAFLEALQGA